MYVDIEPFGHKYWTCAHRAGRRRGASRANASFAQSVLPQASQSLASGFRITRKQKRDAGSIRRLLFVEAVAQSHPRKPDLRSL